MKYVTVTFFNDTSTNSWSSKQYVYLAEDNQIIEGAEYAVVMAPSDIVKAVKIVHVEDFDSTLYNGKYKFIICMVDTKDYFTRIEKVNRMEHIRRALEKRAKKAIEARAWKDLLVGDADAKKLMDELDQLER